MGSDEQKKEMKQRRKKKKREREKNKARGHRKSGALIHMPSHHMVCLHPGDVATKCTQAPFKSLLLTISSCSHVGRELEL